MWWCGNDNGTTYCDCGGEKKFLPRGLVWGLIVLCRGNSEDAAQLLREEVFLFQPGNMVSNGIPDGSECFYLVLHSHVILHRGFREVSLGAYKGVTFLFQFLQLRDSSLKGR